MVGGSQTYTLVCQFPFDVIIPLNSRVLWMETLDLEDAPYHSIRSVDNLFGTGSMVSADMGFYDDTFTHGVYEFYDDFAESLTGKIIISKSTNSININEEVHIALNVLITIHAMTLLQHRLVLARK